MSSMKITINGEEVNLNEDNLKFDETTLTNYLQVEGGYYNNFGGKLAIAEFILQRAEIELEALEGTKFSDIKENEGGSDKLVDAKVDRDADVIASKEKVAAAKLNVRLLNQHLKAWDKNHENAQSLGHTLRKEMDKLNANIYKGEYPRYEEIEKMINEKEEK